MPEMVPINRARTNQRVVTPPKTNKDKSMKIIVSELLIDRVMVSEIERLAKTAKES